MIFDNVKVGDRFKAVSGFRAAFTVTEITEKGFKYKLDVPHHVYPARYGPSLTEGGEIFSVGRPDVEWDRMYERV